MRPLLLVRHAESRPDPDAGPRSWELTARGRRSCAALAGALREWSPSTVVSSDERKAVQTARLVAAELGVGWEVVGGLHEHRRGPGLLEPAAFRAAVRSVFDRPGEAVFGAESGDAARSRFLDAVRGVLASTAGPVVVVSHGTVISLATGGGFELWERLTMPAIVVADARDMAVLRVVTFGRG